MLRGIFGCKLEEVTGNWRKLHSEELVGLIKYYSGDQIEENAIGVACRCGGHEKCIQGFGG